MKYNQNFRLALTEAALATGRLFVRQLPPPSLVPYQDHSVKVGKGEGGQSLHGYQRCTFMWDNMATKHSYVLRTLIQAALDSAGGVLYATIDRSNGTAPGGDWIDVYGVPIMPDFAPGAARGIRNGVAHSNVQLVINNLTIVNDPAVY